MAFGAPNKCDAGYFVRCARIAGWGPNIDTAFLGLMAGLMRASSVTRENLPQNSDDWGAHIREHVYVLTALVGTTAYTRTSHEPGAKARARRIRASCAETSHMASSSKRKGRLVEGGEGKGLQAQSAKKDQAATLLSSPLFYIFAF